MSSEKKPSVGQIVSWINKIMGQNVITKEQLEQIFKESHEANSKGGLEEVIKYILKITESDINPEKLKNFAEAIKNDPAQGLSFIKKARQK